MKNKGIHITITIPSFKIVQNHKFSLLIIGLFTVIVLLSGILVRRYLEIKQLAFGDLPIVNIFFPSQHVITQRITEEVLPKEGFQTKIYLGNAITKLVSYGVIDKGKIEELYKGRGGLASWQKDMLSKSSKKPLVITQENSVWLVNILWPLGLSNKMGINNQSPIAGENVRNYASTGGWNLGKEENGGVYFNKYSIIHLSPKQEQHVKYLADRIYRPCCNNSTFFQDCNHGSAALALIELGVSQGLSDKEIYNTALAFNSFWFPQNYVETALYLKRTKGTDWKNIDVKLVLSKQYSSISGWIANIDTLAQKIPGLLPQQAGGGSCGA